MAVNLIRRLSASRGFVNSFRENHSRRFPIGAAAAISGGIALYYCCSPTSMVQLDPQGEQTAGRIALDPDKWLEFKLQETARVSHNTQLYRFSFDPSAKLGLYVASCIITRYTPISDPDSKGYFDLLIKVYPEGKMSQHFASLKPGDVLEVKGPIEKLRYSPNMKKKLAWLQVALISHQCCRLSRRFFETLMTTLRDSWTAAAACGSSRGGNSGLRVAIAAGVAGRDGPACESRGGGWPACVDSRGRR